VARNFPNWLDAFLEYSSFGEAPKRMYFWTGISVLAGALRRKVWFEQGYFRWYPNFYIVLVAKPGIVSKSTTASIGTNLLRKVEGIRFGPDAVTPAALAASFAEAKENFEYGEEWVPQCALTFASSEFGTLYDPQDHQMTNFLIELYDGVDREFKKATKHSGSDSIENPLMNLIACTTPSWIATNFKETMISGGLVSRMIFVYAEGKEKFSAYPGYALTPEIRSMELRLIDDLRAIAANLVGPFKLDLAARRWGEKWYSEHWHTQSRPFEAERFGGYIARKQAHLHKLAMILAVAEGDSLTITQEHLELALTMLEDIESDFGTVFGQMGRSLISGHAERLIQYIHKNGEVTYKQAYSFMHGYFPQIRDFEQVVLGAVRAGYLRLFQKGNDHWLGPDKPPEQPN
jgi:hypothetical protein